MSTYKVEELLRMEISERDYKLCEYSHIVEKLEKKLAALELETFEIFKENCLLKGIDWRHLADIVKDEAKYR